MTDIGTTFTSYARYLLKSDYLPKIERCLEKLSDENIWWRPNAESNSIGNLILHLAGNAPQWIVSGVGGAPDLRQRQEEFDARLGPVRSELQSTLVKTIDEIDHVLSNLAPESLLNRRIIQGNEVCVLEAILHVVEHFSMHTGQIILLTKVLTQNDLRFYDFSTGDPVTAWHKSDTP
jgi:uncharacterized damage-inducible protein DinB